MAERSKAPHSSVTTCHIQCGLRSRKRRGFKSHSCHYSFFVFFLGGVEMWGMTLLVVLVYGIERIGGVKG
ncbi:hypothetical protein EX30DRAFT_256380 [Ascodesmis nigricans]|uniref:Uncharacterized protein n=1 Tax=Ascodesmis nigricans TaxID=341454 RepID=A0A4S2MHL3_9PEZI|nr:hypothetical protein EX30DRAFT_256380 [Ascodesmis nigricans]